MSTKNSGRSLFGIVNTAAMCVARVSDASQSDNGLSCKASFTLGQGSANVLGRGPNNEMISLSGPQLVSKEKHSTHFNIVLLYLSKNYIYIYASEQNLDGNNMESAIKL